MKDEETMILIECINLNVTLSGGEKLDLIRKVMNDCREKQIGKMLIRTIEKKVKKVKKETTPTRKETAHTPEFYEKQKQKQIDKEEKQYTSGKTTKTDNALQIVNSIKADNEGRY